MKQKILPWIISICALGLGATAAYYSIIGLSKLFAGVATAVIIMATFLEISKLTLASMLHTYWDKLNKFLRSYYILALTVLSLITSAGIYGMLSSGYQSTLNDYTKVEDEVKIIRLKINNLNQSIESKTLETSQLSQNISDLRKGLANNVIQYKDRETGQIITTTSSSNRRAYNDQLNIAVTKKNTLSQEIEELSYEVHNLEMSILNLKSKSEASSELGPLKYISTLTGISMDRVINWLLLVIIFVFDPLAISLVVAASQSFDLMRKKPESEVDEEQETYDEEDDIINAIWEDKAEDYKDFVAYESQATYDEEEESEGPMEVEPPEEEKLPEPIAIEPPKDPNPPTPSLHPSPGYWKSSEDEEEISMDDVEVKDVNVNYFINKKKTPPSPPRKDYDIDEENTIKY